AECESGTSKNSNGTRVHMSAKVTMHHFAEVLTGEVHRPAVDKTGLPGAYEITLDYSPDDRGVNDDTATGPSLFTALQEQLGLKLASAKGPVDTIVVDQAERRPTEN